MCRARLINIQQCLMLSFFLSFPKYSDVLLSLATNFEFLKLLETFRKTVSWSSFFETNLKTFPTQAISSAIVDILVVTQVD